ncbi:MAG: PH domain-containing protein [Candidatus Leucobacter sulfamidivorax]|nr:PH domain-containing protein [Candidatus Leucobacter sulfamidivorax]
MPMVRAQSVQLRRPLLHRMLGLASVQAHTVLGPVRMEMRGIALARAREIFDLLAATAVRVQAEESWARSARVSAGAEAAVVPVTEGTAGIGGEPAGRTGGPGERLGGNEEAP